MCIFFFNTQFLELFNAYYNSLLLPKNYNLHSISFPLISSGIFRGNLSNPAGESAKQCGYAYKKFIQEFPNHEVDLILSAFGSAEFQNAKDELESLP